MKRVVLDASALMTFFENRPGADKVEELIQQGMNGKRHLLMSIVNWGEIYYSVWRAKGPGVAQKVIEDIARLPIELVDADCELTQQAAELRAQTKLPYVDGFAAALARERKAELATSDADFACLEPKMKIIWAK
ncbi:MAG: type II toxin-antitoxin system VapC family toxin [Acidobacteria bacterium]|nr:type II toxin-antitoxin system VapC family toxin [Acidobacteriota bacterium]MBS1867963.1 type II toxin-antitoxin system VapC family toxin [Acidobacteriota bacterium]